LDKEQTSDLILLTGCADYWLSSVLAGRQSEGEKLVDNLEVHFDDKELADELSKRFDRAVKLVKTFKHVSGKHYFLELQLFDTYLRTRYLNQQIEKISQIVGLPVVATGDVHYPHPEDWEIQRLSNSIAWNVPVDQLAERRDYEAGKAAYPTSDREVAT